MNRFKKIIIFCLIFLFIVFFNYNNVSASTENLSEVLNDLSYDKSFDISNYTSMTYEYWLDINNDIYENNDQLEIEVIQIAESSDKELYIYTYQPMNDDDGFNLKANSILMSLKYTTNGEFETDDLKIYDLELVSKDSVFNKYLVKDFSICNDNERFYNIVTIYREYNEFLDEVHLGGELDGTEFGLEVGQQWCAYYQNNVIVYEMNTFDTMEIEVVFTGSIGFAEGFNYIGGIAGNRGHAWFVAFKCEDYIIRHIFDADVSFKKREVKKNSTPVQNTTTYGEWVEDEVFLSKADTVSYDGKGLLNKAFTWKRISRGNAFLENFINQNCDIDNALFNNVYDENIWVFAFTETESWALAQQYQSMSKYTDIEDVTIIRIRFMDFSGKTYNLGVVGDRVNPDNKDDGVGKFENDEDKTNKLIELIIKIISLIVLLIIFITLIPYIKPLINIIISILFVPFNLIGKLFKKKKRK